MRIAYSTLACPGWTVERAADAAVAHGYDGVEWRLADGALLDPRTDERVFDRIRTASRERGLEIVCIDTSVSFVHESDAAREAAVRDGRAMSQIAADAGCDLVRVFGGRVPKDATHGDVLKETAAALGEVMSFAERLGVRVAIETHDDWASTAEVMRLARESGAEVLWDVHHPYRAGEDPGETLDRLSGWIALVHVKDALRTEGGDWMLTPLGDGELPLAQMIDALQDMGYDGFLTFEWEKRWHPDLAEPEEVLPVAAAYLRSLGR